MDVITKHTPGTFCWVELATTDSEAAKKFYKEMFGWEAVDQPMGDGNVYTMLKIGDQEIGAMYKLNAEHKEVPPNWLPYITVDNADDTIKKIENGGGSTCVGPFDVSDAGRMAVINGADGEYFGIWQPKKHIGAKVKNVPGSFCWNELAIRDKDKTVKFYSSAFGWNSTTKTFGEIEYTTYKVGEEPAAGMYVMPENMSQIPTHWLIYFVVENGDKACEICEKEGGTVVMAPMEIPEVGRFATLQDPQGAVFGIIAPK